jgi:Mrp family chromosome partitioning ATPase/capsular polysaccharide biosynthesis protein
MHFRQILAGIGLCVALGLAYAFTAPPRFTGQASLLIDQPSESIPNFDGFGAHGALDVATVETQMQILRSQRVALAVVRRLDLATDERFNAEGQDILSAAIATARGALGGLIETLITGSDSDSRSTAVAVEASAPGIVPTGTAAEEAAVRRLRAHTSVSRAGASYVIDVSYTASDPVLAAAIPNALAEAYIADRRNARYEAAEAATQWLQLITPASVPTDPTGPRKSLILVLSAILGCGIGLTGAVVRASLDQSIRSPRQLADIGLPCLAVLPMLGGRAKRVLRGKAKRNGASLYHLACAADQPLSEFATGLRRAKISVTLSASGHGPGGSSGFVVGLVSAVAGEGASTVASNLAYVFAQGGQRTILVDADKHRVDSPLQLSAASQCANETLPLEITTLPQLLAGRRGRTEGPLEVFLENASDLLTSSRMRAAFAELRQTHRCIILDLPPLERLPDAIAVSPIVDGFVVVCEWGRTPRFLIEDAVDSLKSHEGTVIGAILNKADRRVLRILGFRNSRSDYSEMRQQVGRRKSSRRASKRAAAAQRVAN